MRYYLIAGEASGDLHASRLMQSLKAVDPIAEFRFFGGDRMKAVGGTCVRHIRDLAYMGFVPVLLHLNKILGNMKLCKRDIVAWKPDVVILVDYAGFNLGIAKFLHKKTNIRVYYYISPKIWAWKEWRIKAIKRDVNEMFSILPFEVDFYEKKHHYPIHYVGNPTAEEVRNFRSEYKESREDFLKRHGFDSRPIIAILAGSRKQEIKDNLPAMIEASKRFEDYQLVLACAPSVEAVYYNKFLTGTRVKTVTDETYQLLTHSTAALVTSGTATLETALFNVPQVVCYETPLPKLIRFCFNHIIKVDYISLVNLIANREVVPELLADRFKVYYIANELYNILPGHPLRQAQFDGYRLVAERLSDAVAPDNAARIIYKLLWGNTPVDEPSVEPLSADEQPAEATPIE